MRAETEFRHVYFTKEEQKGERGGRGEREREIIGKNRNGKS
jgi:hypothetical protein